MYIYILTKNKMYGFMRYFHKIQTFIFGLISSSQIFSKKLSMLKIYKFYIRLNIDLFNSILLY